MEIYKSLFSNISFDTNEKTIVQNWSVETQDMISDEFKKEMLVLADAYEKYRPKKVLVLQKDFKFIVTIELQTWTAQNVASKLVLVGAEQLAIVVSGDLFASVSVQQAMEEKEDVSIDIKYFDTEKDARKWLNIN